MAPGIHPPCTPQSSCQPMRCHPTVPPCPKPERCLKKTISKGIAPCQSAVSIMATRSRAGRCGTCGMFNAKNAKDARKQQVIIKYLKRKRKEAKMAKKDMLTGSHKLLKYQRRKGTKKEKADCCAGHGHRGRLKRGRGKAKGPPGKGGGCTIL